jgi:hypothetical protein
MTRAWLGRQIVLPSPCEATEAVKRLADHAELAQRSDHGAGYAIKSGPNFTGRHVMTVARVTKLTASSSKGFQDAVQAAVSRATKTLHGITGLEVISQKAKIVNGKIAEYRVTVEVTFILD